MAIRGRVFSTQNEGWRGRGNPRDLLGSRNSAEPRGKAHAQGRKDRPWTSSCKDRGGRIAGGITLTHRPPLSVGGTLPFSGLITSGNLLSRKCMSVRGLHTDPGAQGARSQDQEHSGVGILSRRQRCPQRTCGSVWRQVWLSQPGTEELLASHGWGPGAAQHPSAQVSSP